MEAAGEEVVVVPVAEFAPGVEFREHDFQARDFQLRVRVHRYAPAIVLHADRVAGLVKRHDDRVGVLVQVLVDGVVDDFPDEVVQPLGVHGADVHRRPDADGLEPLEGGNVRGRVGRGAEGGGHRVVSFLFRYWSYRFHVIVPVVASMM